MSRGLREERFLILAPEGRDGERVAALLDKEQIACERVGSIGELCRAFEEGGAAALLIAEEVFAQSGLQPLSELLARQSAWSDIPVLVLTSAPQASAHPSAAQVLATLGNVTFLDRPLRPVTMLSAARSALRARKRQYAARAELVAQQRAVHERDQFLAMLGHELRNPLSAITMALNLQRDEAGAKYREIMRRQVGQLTRLVDDLLEVSRVTSGKVTLRCERLDLGALVQRCYDNLGSTLARHHASLRLPSQPVWVQADALRLEQVVNNLLQNAAKYTPAGGHVWVALEDEGDQVTLSVRDDGVGIAPDLIGRVFDLFTQAAGTLDRTKGGMGIGLTLVRSLVELHGGSVEALSAGLNKGAMFCVRLPAAAWEPERESVERTGRRALRPREILLIEDNDDSRELLATLLTNVGHKVTTAADGLSGLQRALESRPDVMLVDIGLPGLDGYGVAARVRKEWGDEPFMIAITGYGQPSDRARALAAGFDEHLTKPADINVIESLLAERPERPAEPVLRRSAS